MMRECPWCNAEVVPVEIGTSMLLVDKRVTHWCRYYCNSCDSYYKQAGVDTGSDISESDNTQRDSTGERDG